MDTLQNIYAGLKSLLSHSIGEPLLFSSGLFWVMFIGFIFIYAWVRNRRTQMMLYVAAFSLFFYYLCNGAPYHGEPFGHFLVRNIPFLLLPFTAFMDWHIARRIAASSTTRRRRGLLILSICLSVGILLYFKYTYFLVDTWNALTSGNIRVSDIILPVGISFYTFQSISYVVDVYKGRVEATNSYLQYIFYLSFFPLILAGPIMRAAKFFPQIRDKKQVSRAMIYGGLWLVILGIVKKAVFADYIAQYNNWVFADPLHYSGYEGAMAILGYTAQIYCDFSGYSDMSIGMAAIMGFDLGKNFNFPYQARNLSDFWRRWHISLSTWMRDYIYIPIGGNRCAKWRNYLNNMLTMLVAGLWHGASWMFVIWGAGHGVGLIVQKINKPWLDKLPDNWLVRGCSWLLTFLFVAVLWVFFRSSSVEQACALLGHICNDFNLSYVVPFFQARSVWCLFVVLTFLWHTMPPAAYERLREIFVSLPWMLKLLLFLLVVQLVIQFRTDSVQPFIYFGF